MALIKIDGLPFLKMVIFHGELLNNQMVYQNHETTKCIESALIPHTKNGHATVVPFAPHFSHASTQV